MKFLLALILTFATVLTLSFCSFSNSTGPAYVDSDWIVYYQNTTGQSYIFDLNRSTLRGKYIVGDNYINTLAKSLHFQWNLIHCSSEAGSSRRGSIQLNGLQQFVPLGKICDNNANSTRTHSRIHILQEQKVEKPKRRTIVQKVLHFLGITNYIPIMKSIHHGFVQMIQSSLKTKPFGFEISFAAEQPINGYNVNVRLQVICADKSYQDQARASLIGQAIVGRTLTLTYQHNSYAGCPMDQQPPNPPPQPPKPNPPKPTPVPDWGHHNGTDFDEEEIIMAAPCLLFMTLILCSCCCCPCAAFLCLCTACCCCCCGKPPHHRKSGKPVPETVLPSIQTQVRVPIPVSAMPQPLMVPAVPVQPVQPVQEKKEDKKPMQQVGVQPQQPVMITVPAIAAGVIGQPQQVQPYGFYPPIQQQPQQYPGMVYVYPQQ